MAAAMQQGRVAGGDTMYIKPDPAGHVWRVLTPGEQFQLPPGAKPNAKGNILYTDPQTFEPRWVPPEGIAQNEHGYIALVEPRVCSSCMLKQQAAENAARSAGQLAVEASPSNVPLGEGRYTWDDVRRAFLKKLEGKDCLTCHLQAAPPQEDYSGLAASVVALGLAALVVTLAVPPGQPRPQRR